MQGKRKNEEETQDSLVVEEEGVIVNFPLSPLPLVEQQGNHCSNFRDQYFGNMGFEQNFPTKLENIQIATLINPIDGTLIWSKDISSHASF